MLSLKPWSRSKKLFKPQQVSRIILACQERREYNNAFAKILFVNPCVNVGPNCSTKRPVQGERSYGSFLFQ